MSLSSSVGFFFYCFENNTDTHTNAINDADRGIKAVVALLFMTNTQPFWQRVRVLTDNLGVTSLIQSQGKAAKHVGHSL